VSFKGGGVLLSRSVIGFDDGPMASRLSPALTTIRVPIRDMGRLAASKLIPSNTNDPDARGVTRIVPHLVVRDSTQPPHLARSA
jgi:LacI family transcriptional regulator